MSDTGNREIRRRAGLAQTSTSARADSVRGGPPRWRRVVAFGAAVVMVMAGALGGLVAYAAMTLPNVQDIGKQVGTIRILDDKGRLISEVGADQEARTTVTLAQIAPIMQQAILAAEDRQFYSEGALDLPRIAKALIVDVILRSPAEGASTITQQLAKQAFFGTDAEKSPLRKLREALIAKKLDDSETKGQILAQYLNITYFGENAYGIENAAERYFGKHAAQLTLQESAMLAGIVEAPSGYDPYTNPDAAYARMHYVLTGLVSMGTVTQAQAAAVDPLDTTYGPAAQKALQADLQRGHSGTLALKAPHFAQYIQDELAEMYADDPSVLEEPLTVETTLDLDTQAKAQAAVTNGVAKLKAAGTLANNGALLMIDPNTGAIKAMVGSANFNDDSIAGQYNVTTAERRPGSSFKPYVYETGFMNGALSPSTILDDTAAESRDLGGVQDFDREYMGQITAATSLVNSRNISTEQAMERAGVSNVINFAHTLGITTPLAPNASTAIGTSAVRMIDQVGAYAAFANGGRKIVAYGIDKVLDGNTLIYENESANSDTVVMTPQQAWAITNILRGYSQRWSVPIKYPNAAKSGTTDNFVDAWYMVYTPSYVVATWAGRTSGTNPAEQPMNELFGTTEGTFIAAPFINSLPAPKAFTPASGSLVDCNPAHYAGGVAPPACTTPTPAPTSTASPSPTDEQTPTPIGAGTPPPLSFPPSPTPTNTVLPPPTP